MVNGRYDPNMPLKTSQEPLLEDLKRANGDTRHAVLYSRHAPPIDESFVDTVCDAFEAAFRLVNRQF